MSAVERDVKPRNMNFAKVDKRGGGRLIGRGRLLQKIRYVFLTYLWGVLFTRGYLIEGHTQGIIRL